MSPSQLSRIETGQRQLFLHDFIRICAALKENPGDLLPNSVGTIGPYLPLIRECEKVGPDIVPVLIEVLHSLIRYSSEHRSDESHAAQVS